MSSETWSKEGKKREVKEKKEREWGKDEGRKRE